MPYLLSEQKIKVIIWCRVIKAVNFLNDPKISSQKEICAVEYQFYKKDTRCGQLNELH